MTLRDEIVTKKPKHETIVPYWMFEERPKWIFETPKVYRYNVLRKFDKNVQSAFTNLENKNIKHFRFRYRSKRRGDINYLQADEEDCCITEENGNCYLTMVGLGRMRVFIPKCDRKRDIVPTLAGGVTIRFENKTWYADITYKVLPEEIDDQKRICALDPGQRSFLSGFDLQGNSFQLGIDVQKQLTKLKLRRNLAQSEYDKLRKQNHRSYKVYRKLVRAKRAFYLTTNKIKNYIKQLHYHCCKYLTDNYDKIIIPIYQTKKMIQKGKKKFNEMILSLNHFRFREMLIAKCQILRKRVLVCTEEYTSVTCGSCDSYKMDLEDNKIYECSRCSYKADRDENAAFNILRYVVNAALRIKSIE